MTTRQQAWAARNPERMREIRAAWKARNRQRIAYVGAARAANVQAEKYGASGRITGADVRAVLEGAACVYCGAATRLSIDHRAPLSRGGRNTRENLQAACGACNSSKHDGPTPWRWSRYGDACRECGRSDRPHNGYGYCGTCYRRRWQAGTLVSREPARRSRE